MHGHHSIDTFARMRIVSDGGHQDCRDLWNCVVIVPMSSLALFAKGASIWVTSAQLASQGP
eukprot:2050634-Amphidinium_carterae.1